MSGYFGESVAGVPDADGDGRGDLFVGAPGEDPGTSPTSAGRAYLFSGNTGAPLFELQSPNEEFQGSFGYSVAGVPDTDGDGRGDLLVGANQEDPGASLRNAGRAYLFSGASGSGFDLTATALTSLTVAPGGSVQFAYTVTNGTDAAVSGDLFFIARQGTSTVASGRILSGTLGAGETTTGTFVQQVPLGAPVGTYTYDLNIGQFPSAIADTETFTAVVTPAARPGSGDGSVGWAVLDAGPWQPEAAPTQAAAQATMPSTPALSAYPNPFRTRSSLRFTLGKASPVWLAIYDVLGREVAVLTDGVLDAGPHEVTFDGSDLPSGVYLWRLEANDWVETGRLTIVR